MAIYDQSSSKYSFSEFGLPSSEKSKTGVSVIIPTYNSVNTLKESILSVLSQNFHGNYELIVVDDASQDNTQDILVEIVPMVLDAGASIKIITLAKNLGSSAARNVGLANAHYDLIMPFDADDLFLATKESPNSISFMQKAYDILESDKLTDVVFCDIRNFGAINNVHIFPEFDPKTYLEKCTIWMPGMHRKETSLAIGGWDTTLRTVQDFAYWAKMLQFKEQQNRTLKAVRIPEPLYLYRRYPIKDTNHDSALTIFNHKLGWQLLIERFPDLYRKYFPDITLQNMPEYFERNELATRSK